MRNIKQDFEIGRECVLRDTGQNMGRERNKNNG